MKVTVFGIGYVGLVQAAVLADAGHEVMCIDVDQNKVDNLKKGLIPIYEPGLTPLVEQNYAAGRLQFTTDAAAGVAFGEFQFIAVGTPPDEDGSADLGFGNQGSLIGQFALGFEAMGSNDELFLNEGADLLFHYLMLLANRGYSLADVVKILQQRNQAK